MLDRKFVADNVELVETNCRNRGVDADVRGLVAIEQQRRKKQAEAEELNRQANEISKSIGKAKDAEEREARKNEGRRLREEKDAAQGDVQQLQEEIDEILGRIPNLSHPDAPVGADDKANLELRRGLTELPAFDFRPRDHVEIGELLDLFDFGVLLHDSSPGGETCPLIILFNS